MTHHLYPNRDLHLHASAVPPTRAETAAAGARWTTRGILGRLVRLDRRRIKWRARQPTPASRKARFSFSISRAITSRWIWFVPS